MSMPQYFNIYGAWFFLLLIPLIILYFLKLKRPRVTIPSLVLWQSVVNDQRVNSPFQMFRRSLLLLLQIILLCLLVMALMQPFLKSDAEVAEYLPVLVDCSASMGATDEITGKTRLDIVREQLREKVENLTGDQKMALFSFASTGRRLTEFTDDRQVLLRALDELQPTHQPGSLEDVLRQAWALTQTYPVERILVFSDTNLPEKVDFELPFRLEIQRVDAGGPNIGITEMSARRSGAESWDVFLRISGSTTDLRGGELQLYQDGELLSSETIEVAADEAERLILTVTSTQSSIVEARLAPTGADSVAADNNAWLTLPRPRPLNVWVAPELTAWRHALAVAEGIEVEISERPTAPEYDVLISDREDINSARAAVQVFVGVVPADLGGPGAASALSTGESSAPTESRTLAETEDGTERRTGDSPESSGQPASNGDSTDASAASEVAPSDGGESVRRAPVERSSLIEIRPEIGRVVTWNRTEPILRHVQLAELQLGINPAYAQGVDVSDLEERGYEVLIDGTSGPLLLRRREGLTTSYYFTFHTDRSTLPYRVAFPVMVANLLESGLDFASLNDVNSAATGVLPHLNLDPRRTYSITRPDGSVIQSTTDEAGVLSGIPAPRTGRYDVRDGDDLVTTVGASLLDPLETSLATVDEFAFTELKVRADSDGSCGGCSHWLGSVF
ncbi:MAG: BatA domain-containing protein [Planctomycetaceae bacterium]|nr:BatA domain-containing protein [Planctomycetaceae bacterium]